MYTHIPKQMLHKDTDTLVLFIHGFMGTPNQFTDFMDTVYKSGVSAVSVLLPGHGSSGFAFAKCTLEDWEAHLKSEIACYSHYKNIYLIGHSIGGLLALNLSTESNVRGVIAISTPLKVYIFHPFHHYIKLKILFSKRENEIKKCYLSSKSIGKPYFRSMILWPRVLLQPHRLIRKTVKHIQQITVPVLTIHSKKDETASFKSIKLFEKLLTNVNHEAVLLKDSLHAYYCEDERAAIAAAILDFIIV